MRIVAGDPLGNGSLLNRGASNASLERERKCWPPSVAVFLFIYLLFVCAILGKDKLIGHEAGKRNTDKTRKTKAQKKQTKKSLISSVDGRVVVVLQFHFRYDTNT